MNVLQEAEQAVSGPRRDDYGSPLVNHSRTAALWSVLFGIEITPEQVCWANVLQKAARCMHVNTRDGLVDVAGYMRNIELILNEREQSKVRARPDGVCKGRAYHARKVSSGGAGSNPVVSERPL